METFLEILKYVIPSLIVLLTAFIVMKAFLESEQKRKETDITLDRQQTILPLKVQAYERMILFLERITPHNLILRISNPEMNAAQLQAALIRSVREEFEHNLSQQLFISEQAWQLIKNAKEDMIRIIGAVGAETDPQKPSQTFATKVMERYLKEGTPSINRAISFLREEFSKLV